MLSFKEEWLNFQKKVVNKEAGELQRKEMKVSFYSGALAFFGLQLALTEFLGEVDASIELDSLINEINDTLDKHIQDLESKEV